VATFTDKSTSAEGIKEYLFDFGDSTVQQFTGAPFTHQYADTGLYNVKLVVTDVANCSNTYTLPAPIRISGVNANFGSATTVYCPGFPVTFTDSSAGNGLTYNWNFGDGGTSTDKNPVHTYATAGVYTISLTATDAFGCTDTIVRTDYLTIRRPAADFTVTDSVSFCPPFEVGFQITGTDFVSHSWDFGDGQTGTLADERHFYNDYGTYTAKLYLYGNGGCVDSTMKQIQVVLPSSIPLTYSPLDSCNQITVDFDIVAPPSTRYIFLFGDGKTDSTQQATFQHFYDQPGLYFPVATFTDKGGCIVNRAGGVPIRVRGAQPFFGVDQTSFCDSGTVTFTNFTIGNDPVVSYLWDFDDNNTSAAKDVVHTFTSPGTYIVSLTVNTASGCSDTVYDTINVYTTPVTVIGAPDTICVNAVSTFNGLLNQADTTGISYNWNFGDGSGSTQRNTTHVYTTPGDYTVTLDTKVAFGCASSTTKTVHVVPLPTITFANDPLLASGRSIDLPVSYTGPIVSYNWSPPGTLSCATCPIPKATPEKTTKYQVTVIDSFGCTATNAVTVMVVCGDKNLFLPNTFSPNGDGSNERFYPRGGGLFQVKYLRIFNRWGEQIFEKMNFPGNQASEGWDGTYKGKPAPADVYVYIIEIVCENSEYFQYKGNIMLLR
jgi:gliding motility-associated-like protein